MGLFEAGSVFRVCGVAPYSRAGVREKRRSKIDVRCAIYGGENGSP